MMRTKKLQTDIVAAFLLICLACVTVAAWFISSVGTTEAAFVAGTVEIEAGRVLDAPGVIPVDEDNWNPGDESLVAYRVDNVGTLAADLRVELSSHWINDLPDDNVVISVAGDNKDKWIQDASNPDIYRYNEPFTGTAYLYLSVKMLGQETGNLYQGQTFVLNQTFYASAEAPPPPPPSGEYGALYITKAVTGNNAPQENFDITVRFSGPALGTILHDGVNKADGLYELKLSAGQWATFTNIPSGTTYVITETLTEAQYNSGWTAPGNISGEITAANETDTVTVNNKYDAGVLGIEDDNPDGGETIEIKLPQTGGVSASTIIALTGLTLTVGGAVAYLTLRRRINAPQ